ncbi:MAG: aminotransferase DegT [Acidobacteria bacterium SCN 69-37]|mgnify:CR=1 FL=1|nr:MAG: aminotransferase DegT [Acidobacteria bacterium SCN 69-37]
MIPIAKPLVGEAEAEAARRPITSGWLTQGPEVAAFEQEFAASVGAAHACAVSNCTTALHLALLAAGVGPGDEVVTVSHSFIATANAIRYGGGIPVFVDIDAVTGNMDPAQVDAAVTSKTRAILCVHQIGMPCDMPALLAVSARRGLPLIEDAACAIGSSIRIGDRWEAIGKPHGDIACFSFHPRKVITTGDGGMITTNNGEFDRKFRLWRQHGMSVPDSVRHGSPTVIFESYPVLGFNYRMTDVQAAIGREQLKRLPGIIESRRRLAARYHEALAAVPGVTPPHEPAWARSNWQSYGVRLADGIDQRRFMQAMLDRGVSTRRGIMNAHLEGAYAHEPWRAGGGLTASEAAQDEVVLLPLYAQMTTDEQDTVVEVLKTVVAELGGA